MAINIEPLLGRTGHIAPSRDCTRKKPTKNSRFTDKEISNLHLLGRLLGQTRHFATAPLSKEGRNHLFEMLDAAHNIPAALLNPDHYEITEDVNHLKKFLVPTLLRGNAYGR
jgi:hypothetical protein